MKAIKTFEEACEALGYPTELPVFLKPVHKHHKAIIAHYKLVIIVEAVNDGWQPNWADMEERKFELWPDIVEDKTKPSGFGLSYDGYGVWDTATYVGSRLCFVSREAAKHTFETFKELYEEYLLIG